jgi:predicted acylesterase/phospholipase RssA
MPIQALGIFEGGGAKGLAHVGALKSIEGRVDFVGVAGSSAGAIVAALVAVGYTADELYTMEHRNGELNIDVPYTIFGQLRWEEWKDFAEDFKKTFCRASLWRAWARAPFFYLRHVHVIDRIQNEPRQIWSHG